MGYELQAVIAEDEVLRGASQDLPAARVASLGRGLSLIPMTDQLFDAVTDGTEGALGFCGFREGSTSGLRTGQPLERWPTWKPSTSVVSASNALLSGPMGPSY